MILYNRLLNPLEEHYHKNFFYPFHLALKEGVTKSQTIPFNLYESEQNYLLLIKVETYKKEDFDITANHSSIDISINNEIEDIHRKVSFKERIKTENIKAKYEEGILYITIEKDIKEPKKIEITE